MQTFEFLSLPIERCAWRLSPFQVYAFGMQKDQRQWAQTPFRRVLEVPYLL